MLQEIGAGYTDNLTSKNTHLICKYAVGKKYEKACEWGLHVVSVEWLYHVMRYGYKEGCEGEFSLRGAAKSDSVEKKRVCSDLPSIETSHSDNGAATKEQETSDKVVTPKTSISKSHKRGREQLSSDPLSQSSEDASLVAPKGDETCNSNVTPKADETCNNDASPKASKSPSNVNQRLHSALQTLETSNPSLYPRRSQRRRIPIIDTDDSPSLLTQERSPQFQQDEEPEQTEQFTIRVDAVVGTAFQCSDVGGEVPISQVNHAEDNGESQVVWFAERCGR